jgi:hypothetical protein
MKITQISVFLENKPGRLQNVLKILSDNEINIQTLTIAEVNDFGVLRMIVNRPDEAAEALKAGGVTSSKTEVLAVAIDDVPGALLTLIDVFANHKINIEYMYAFTAKADGRPVMLFRFEDIELARKALIEEGYRLLKAAEIYGE